MRLFVSGNSITISKLVQEYPFMKDHLGVLITPVSYPFRLDMPIAADNCAYAGFDEEAYDRMLLKLTHYQPIWVAVPDVVCNAKATLELFQKWKPRINKPLAFVAQDGIDKIDIPWDDFQCLFIGGSTEFKLSMPVFYLIEEAKRRGKLVHIGRVNTMQRVDYFWRVGVDSFDGSGYSRHSYKITNTILQIVELERHK